MTKHYGVDSLELKKHFFYSTRANQLARLARFLETAVFLDFDNEFQQHQQPRYIPVRCRHRCRYRLLHLRDRCRNRGELRISTSLITVKLRSDWRALGACVSNLCLIRCVRPIFKWVLYPFLLHASKVKIKKINARTHQARASLNVP